MRRIVAIVSALALLLGVAGMSLATEPTTSPYDWQGNGYPNATCDADSTTALWIWTGDSPTSLTINGQVQTGSWTQMGNGSWHFTITIDESNFPPITASVTYTGVAGVLTLSHCDGVEPTPAPTATVAPDITPTPAPTATVAPDITPTPAPSTTPYDWQGNGYPNETCVPDSATALWIWTGDNPTSLTINGHVQTGTWTQMGNGSWHFLVTIDESNFPPITASVTYTGSAGTLTLSHCEGVQPTPSPSTSVAPQITPTPAPSTSIAPVITAAPSTSIAPVITAAPSSSVAAAIGTPRVTPPPTDTLGSVQSAPSNSGWSVVLIGLATLALSVLAFAKPWRSNGRR